MGEAVKKDDDDEENLVPVGPGADGISPDDAEKDQEKDEAEVEDKRLAQKDEDEDEPEDGLSAPARRKESAKERRERLKKQHKRERLERDFLLKRNEDLEKRVMAMEGRQSQTETAAIDQRINQLNVQLANADRVIADALRKPNGGGADEFVEAQRIRDQLRDQLGELTASKRTQQQSGARAERAPEQSQRAAAPDARVVRHARDWASQHDWFDFNSTDEDSVIVRAIDEALAAEGFNPASEEYWEELTARVKRRLPEKFKRAARDESDDEDTDMDAGEPKARTKSGPKFSSGGKERPLKKGEVYVSAERKQAMIDYGVWNDPVARNRMLKRYAEWDAQVVSNKT
jgi:hypothetical protein